MWHVRYAATLGKLLWVHICFWELPNLKLCFLFGLKLLSLGLSSMALKRL